ncbi:unnamed protein product [Soboliphyme baturini]|uniref:AMP-binding domain-containing protein n=1 Tax=Soboliphyme baturini TaxID=241478 RepID=A0A183IKZ4_9BILA|nr:unnamed protein product [Soboliphyme baturini]
MCAALGPTAAKKVFVLPRSLLAVRSLVRSLPCLFASSFPHRSNARCNKVPTKDGHRTCGDGADLSSASTHYYSIYGNFCFDDAQDGRTFVTRDGSDAISAPDSVAAPYCRRPCASLAWLVSKVDGDGDSRLDVGIIG